MGYSYTLQNLNKPDLINCESVTWFGSIRGGGEWEYFLSDLPFERIEFPVFQYGEDVRRPIQTWKHILWWIKNGRGRNRVRWILGLFYASFRKELVFVQD